MSRTSSLRALFASLAVVGISAVALPAHAVFRIQAQNAAGVCQGALPVYDTSLRNRPSAVSNEGTTNAFVSCSMEGDNGGSSAAPTMFGAVFRNNTDANQTVNCTFVDGTPALAPLVLLPKSGEILAGELAQIVWDPVADNGGTPFTAWNNLSCNLPAGVEIQILVRHVEDGSAAPAP